MRYIKLLERGAEIVRRMPENYEEGELDFCKKEFRYHSYDIRLYVIRNCAVISNGFLYENRVSLVEESLIVPESVIHKELRGFNKKTFDFAKKYFFKRKKLDPKKKYLIAFDEWSGNHYHWVCEVLVRLFAVKDILWDFILILPDNKYIRSVGVEMLELLDLFPENILFIKEEEMFYSNLIYIVTRPSNSGYINDVLIKKMKGALNKKLNKNEGEQRNFSRFYVSRERAVVRKVLNEDKILPIIKEHGFDIIHFEDYSFKQQLSMSGNCDTLMSIHGAGLTNMIFMPEGSSIVEFRRNQIYHNQCYWHLADALDHKYYYFFGEPDSEEVIEGNGCNLTLDISKFQKMMNHYFSPIFS